MRRFFARVDTFNASTSGPFGSFLRIHNNGSAAGSVTISVLDEVTGEPCGTAFNHAVAAGATTQLSALQIEDFAAIPPTGRIGTYTVSVTGQIIGYVQHILFDTSRMSPTTTPGEGKP